MQNYTVTRRNCDEEVSETVNSVSGICLSVVVYTVSSLDHIACVAEIQVPRIFHSPLYSESRGTNSNRG